MTPFTGIALIDRLLADAEPSPNRHGNATRRLFHDSSRYLFDMGLSMSRWRQFDTESDAAFFGCWTNKVDLLILTYAEGDVIFTQCADAEHYDAELASMCDFYAPAPSFTTIDEGTVSRYYEDRREHFVDPQRCLPSPILLDNDDADEAG